MKASKKKANKVADKFKDTDFGPKDKNDEIGGKMAMYKTGEMPKKGYPNPKKVEWVYAESLCDPGEKPQFVDDGVSSYDC